MTLFFCKWLAGVALLCGTLAQPDEVCTSEQGATPWGANHMYDDNHVQDDALGCAKYELPWRSDTLQWRVVRNKSSDVLYVTAFAQAAIHKHQNPIDCRGVKYLRDNFPWLGGQALGLGAVMFRLSQGLHHAMSSGRVYIVGSHHQLNLKNSWECQPSSSFECWFESWSSCEPQAGDDVIDAKHHWSKPYATVFQELLQCSPVKESHYLYWFRAQATAYLMRPNMRTRQAMDDFRSQATLWRSDGRRTEDGRSEAVGFKSVSAASLPPGTIGLTVRASDKRSESEVYELSRYVDVADALASGNQSLPVRGHLKQSVPACRAGPSFRFHQAAFAKRHLFFGTEDSHVFGAVANGAAPGWEISAMDQSRTERSVHAQYTVGHQLKHGHGLMIQLLVVLEVMLECDAWVFTFASSWNKLLDTLRATVGRHAFAPTLSLSWGFRGCDNGGSRPWRDSIGCPKDCEACYLSSGGCTLG